jgi:hypothetical protein
VSANALNVLDHYLATVARPYFSSAIFLLSGWTRLGGTLKNWNRASVRVTTGPISIRISSAPSFPCLCPRSMDFFQGPR